MKSEVIIALKNTFVSDTSTLQESNAKLSEFSKNEGYCMCLMQIIDEPSFDVALKQAALIQLKNNIKAKWKPKNANMELSAQEKTHIRNALVLAVIRCAKNHMLIKLYRQVLTTVIGYEYETWVPVHDILNKLQTGQNLAPIFHCIISICTNFEFSVMDKQREIYNQFLKLILPAVFETVKNNLSDSELVYLSLKILWKAAHYQIENSVKILTNNWMELILLTIGAYNQTFQKNIDEIQNKNTPQFFYFHSKKWATRILMRFVQKHARSSQYGKINAENAQYSAFWYSNYGINFCNLIVEQLQKAIPTTKKIRYFQLRVIQAILQDKPQLLSKYASHFQYDVLLKFMTLTQQDETLAKQDVVQYLRNDDEMSSTFSNIKKVATDVWICFMQLQSKLDRDNNVYQPGPLFQENMRFMLSKIQSTNLLQKQLGMYLFCQNHVTINRVPAIKVKMQQILSKYVIPELTNPAILIRSKANDMFYQFGKQITDFNVITKSIQGVFTCLTKDQSPLVRVKAALALNPILSKPESKELLKPYLKDILQVYLKLIEQYDLQMVVTALEYFISDFSEHIGPYAIELFKYLTGVFVKMFNKQMEQTQNQQYNSDIELAASGCLKTMTQILQAPLQPQIRTQIQPCVLDLCAFLFTNQSLDYTEDLMFLMRVHLQKVQKISQSCWFFYQVIIYFIAGIPNQMWNQIQTLNIPQANKQILGNIRQGNNVEYMEFAVPVLRNYFGKGYNMIVAQKQQFKINFIQLILYLINYVHKKAVSGNLQGQIHFDCCSILLVYLIETFPPDMTKLLIPNIWNICKFNIHKGKSIYLKQITCQLLFVALWKNPVILYAIIQKQNSLAIFLKQLQEVGVRLQQQQQRKRVILGICSFFTHIQQMQKLANQAPLIFQFLLKLVKKNCRCRIISNTTEMNMKRMLMDMNDDEDKYSDEDYDDDEDMWDQEYSEKHVSILKQINQLAVFKQTIQNLAVKAPNIYQQVLKAVHQQKLIQVQGILDQAINLPQK